MITPREYIVELKAQHSAAAPVNVDTAPESLKSIAAAASLDPNALLKSALEQDYAEYLLELLLPRAPQGIRRMFDSGWLAAGAIVDPAPAAYVKALGLSGYAIVFHTGLKELVYRVARILATRFVPSKDGNPKMGIEQTARLVAEVFWWFEATGSSFGPTYEIAKEQITIASLLTQEAGAFIVAHEIGHVIAETSGSNATDFGISVDELAPAGYQDEHVADVIGLVLTMGITKAGAKLDPLYTPIRYAGVELVLQIYHALEILGFRFDDTHPAANQRLAHIRATMRRKCSSDETWQGVCSVSQGIDRMLGEMLEIIQDPGEHAAFFEAEARQIAAEFDELLTRCTGGLTPDYLAFYAEAGRIMGQGYSHKLIERVAEIAGDWFKDVGSVAKSSPAEKHAQWLRLQKFKLLLGYFDRLNEPARSLFMEALERSASP